MPLTCLQHSLWLKRQHVTDRAAKQGGSSHTKISVSSVSPSESDEACSQPVGDCVAAAPGRLGKVSTGPAARILTEDAQTGSQLTLGKRSRRLTTWSDHDR